MTEIKEAFDLCHICRVRKLKSTRFKFRQNQVNGFIQRRLDSFFVSNILQESITKTDVVAFLSSDHYPILLASKLENNLKEEELYGNLKTY